MTEIISKYKRGIYDMSGSKKKKGILKKFFEHPLIVALVPVGMTLLGWFALSIWNMNADIREIMVRLNTLDANMNTISESMNNMNTEIQSLKEKYTLLDDRIEHLEGDFSDVFEISLKDNDEPLVGLSADGTYTLEIPKWNNEDVIAIGINNGQEYTAGELVNKKLLIPYKEDGLDVIFYGQYNENNKWNGECLLNVYSGDKLIAINESIFENGDLLRYRQILSDSANNKDAWIVAEKRIIDNDKEIKRGDSWSYSKEHEYIRDFHLEDVELSKLLYVDSFIEEENINDHIIKYYHGSSSDGYYNDDTGNAYLVEYFEDGTVKTLYKGNFVKGKFCDKTGNAWYITKDKNTDYMYYKGKFRDNVPVDDATKDNFINPLTYEQLNSIIQEIPIYTKLKWQGLSENKHI